MSENIPKLKHFFSRAPLNTITGEVKLLSNLQSLEPILSITKDFEHIRDSGEFYHHQPLTATLLLPHDVVVTPTGKACYLSRVEQELYAPKACIVLRSEATASTSFPAYLLPSFLEYHSYQFKGDGPFLRASTILNIPVDPVPQPPANGLQLLENLVHLSDLYKQREVLNQKLIKAITYRILKNQPLNKETAHIP